MIGPFIPRIEQRVSEIMLDANDKQLTTGQYENDPKE
jgi:hypothetical protein